MKKYIVAVAFIMTAILLSACAQEEPKKEGTATPPAATTTQPASPAAATPAPATKPAEPVKPAATQITPAKPVEPVKQPATTTQPTPVKPVEPVAATPTQPAPVAVSSGNISNGSVIFKKSCAGCHGNTGMGDGPAASSLKPKPANFVSADYKDSKGKNPREYTNAEMLDIINNGRKGTAMPAWKKQLTADQINDVLAYVRSLAK